MEQKQGRSPAISIVARVYQKEERHPASLASIDGFLEATGWNHGVIVVRDGSGDRTAACAGATGARVLRHDEDHGRGYPVRWRGYDRRLRNPSDATLVGDGASLK